MMNTTKTLTQTHIPNLSTQTVENGRWTIVTLENKLRNPADNSWAYPKGSLRHSIPRCVPVPHMTHCHLITFISLPPPIGKFHLLRPDVYRHARIVIVSAPARYNIYSGMVRKTFYRVHAYMGRWIISHI